MKYINNKIISLVLVATVVDVYKRQVPKSIIQNFVNVLLMCLEKP